MKKGIIIGGLLCVGVVGAAYGLRGFRISNAWLDGKYEEVKRGSMTIPVSSSGTIESNKLVEIKSKASGEVSKVYVVEGQMIKAGDLLVELDPIDEQRNVNRAQAELDRVRATYQQTLIRLDEAKKNRPLDVAVAEQMLVQAASSYEQSKIEHDKLKDVTDKTDIECRRVNASLQSAQAAWERAKVDLERSKNNLPIQISSAEEDVKVAKAVVDSSEESFQDTKQRLTETKIYAPGDGMVYSIKVRRGEIVQSGKTSLTGGTALMYVADISRMYVIAQVDEADIGSVRKIAPDFARPGATRLVTDEELHAACPKPPPEALDEEASAHSGKSGESADSDGKTLTQTTPEPAATPPADKADDADAVAEPDDAELRKAAEEKAASLVGHRVRITVEAYQTEDFEGIIERILPEPKRLQNVVTFDVRIRLLGNDLQRLLGLEADVQFTADRVDSALLVKNEALASEGKDCFVYVPWRESDSEPWGEKKVPVVIGVTDGSRTHIRSGLKEGERVWVKRPQKTDREKKDEKAKSA